MPKVHMIGNAHLDPVWLWTWQDGYSEVLATFRSALDRMNEDKNYIFTCACACYYKWILETDPAMFEEIKARVREGRWVIVGGWWIQPDCTRPSGESFARQALYSQRFFRKHFGIQAKTGYNVDSFGHNAMMPQLLKEGGMSAYVYMRPGAGAEKEYAFEENMFLWKGADGTVMPTFRIPESYCTNFGNLPEKMELYKGFAEKLGRPEMCFYGVGNHGGGPTKQNLAEIRSMQENTGDTYAHSSPDAYFAELDTAGLPLQEGDLLHHASGCYTALMEIKTLNRRAERHLAAAEKLNLLARSMGLKLPKADLAEAWQNVLFNQFHDIMGGCSIRDAYEDAKAFYGEALSAAHKTMNLAAQTIAWNIDTSIGGTGIRTAELDIWHNENGAPLTIFNPLNWPVTIPVRIGAGVSAVADDGTVLPHQAVRSRCNMGVHGKMDGISLFTVPAMGYATWQLRRKEDTAPANVTGTLLWGDDFLENDWLRLELDANTGDVLRLYDKKAARELLSAPMQARVMDENDSDTWSHAIFSFHKDAGGFADAKLTLLTHGDIFVTLRAESTYGKSVLTRDYTLYRTMAPLFISTKVNWQERHKMLKLAWHAAGENLKPTASLPYGHITREPDGKDCAMHAWVAMTDDKGVGLGIGTDSRTAYDAMGDALRITALRSPDYADHCYTDHTQRDIFGEATDQGEQTFRSVVMPVNGDFEALRRESEQLCEEFPVIHGTGHPGTLPRSAVLGTVTGADVSCLKYAEDGNGIILRLIETQGKDTEAKVSLPAAEPFTLPLTPFRVRTVRIADGIVSDTDFTEI
ncbi:MAG: alpha-mannosidase [Oscillospiraceae bacterium]|nr:alpha-mannosidase [Oscillospiraceae bacterium]